MVSDEDLRKIERLAEQYRIIKRFQSDEWPAAHRSVFRRVQELAQTTFQAYSDSIDTQSDRRLWRRQNRARAESLVQQAVRLQKNEANESAWRMGIENTILDRFSVEVACPTCKHRLWQSEIESSYIAPSRVWTELDQRRLKRQPCTCPPEKRIQDRFEIGTSRLFEQQVEEPVIPDPPIDSLPKQKPDRIIGLRETRNIRELLHQPPLCADSNNAYSVRDLVRCSPFKWQSCPHLFPFFALEAKSSSSNRSFSSIQTQTAFPIMSLLRLQIDLLSKSTRQDRGRPEPLVWFLGYKGSDWRIYGCYPSLDCTSHLTYNIHYLLGGDITTKNGALQLILLVDYIVDWARDVYRPSIITQLTSLATGVDFDNISLGTDTDIVSKEKTILDWMNPSEYGVAMQSEAPAQNDDEYMDPSSRNDIPSLKRTEFGRVRSVSTTTFQLVGLRITEGNVESLLTLLDTPHYNDLRENSTAHSQSARKLVNEMTRYDEVLIVLGADLDDIERVWTDEEMLPATFDEGPETEFCVVFEYRCFINLARDIVRDLSYMAISKSAFDILVKHASFRVPHPGIASFTRKIRRCPGILIKDAINCLRSGSRWQVLRSAISSTLLSISPQPEGALDGSQVRVASLKFGYLNSVRVRFFVEKDILKKAARGAPTLKKELRSFEHARRRFKLEADAWDKRTRNRSFRRMYKQVVTSLEALHVPSECNRCRSSEQDLYALRFWGQYILPMPPVHGAILVVSLEEEPDREPDGGYQQRHDLTLFVLEEHKWLGEEASVSEVVKDLAQDSLLYHTILHEPSTKVTGNHAIVWNLPKPYRKCTRVQEWVVRLWIEELNGRYSPDWKISTPLLAPWVHQQMLLYFLRKRKSYDKALAAVLRYRDEMKEEANSRVRTTEESRELTYSDYIRLTSFWYDKGLSRTYEQQSPPWLPQTLRLSGDSITISETSSEEQAIRS